MQVNQAKEMTCCWCFLIVVWPCTTTNTLRTTANVVAAFITVVIQAILMFEGFTLESEAKLPRSQQLVQLPVVRAPPSDL